MHCGEPCQQRRPHAGGQQGAEPQLPPEQGGDPEPDPELARVAPRGWRQRRQLLLGLRLSLRGQEECLRMTARLR